MKTARSNKTQQSKQGMSKKPRPENKDDMDSRKSKVGDKDRTAKAGKNEKAKTKNPPVKKSMKKAIKKQGKVTRKDSQQIVNH
jgi:hypothetical protein